MHSLEIFISAYEQNFSHLIDLTLLRYVEEIFPDSDQFKPSFKSSTNLLKIYSVDG